MENGGQRQCVRELVTERKRCFGLGIESSLMCLKNANKVRMTSTLGSLHVILHQDGAYGELAYILVTKQSLELNLLSKDDKNRLKVSK